MLKTKFKISLKNKLENIFHISKLLLKLKLTRYNFIFFFLTRTKTTETYFAIYLSILP